MLVLDEQRYIHEDLERLEQGIADRLRDEPKQVSYSYILCAEAAADSFSRFAIASTEITKFLSF